MDDHQKVKFEKRDGKIICGKNVFQQFIIRHFNANIKNLNVGRALQNQYIIADQDGSLRPKGFMSDRIPIFEHVFDSDQSTARSFITGKASLAGDKLSVIGDTENIVDEIDITFEELDENFKEYNRFAWKTNIFFFPSDWEINSEDHWSISIYVPSRTFKLLVADIEANRQPDVSIGVDSDLWANENHEHMPMAQNITWYLEPDKEGRLDRSPNAARGNVASISFTTKSPCTSNNYEKSSLDNVRIESSEAFTLKAIRDVLRVIAVFILIIGVTIIFKR